MKPNDNQFSLCYVQYILHSNFDSNIKNILKTYKIKKIQLLEINKEKVYYINLFMQKDLSNSDVCMTSNKFYSAYHKRRLVVLLKKEDV